MRSHARASSAGSTMRQASRLGRIFRGAIVPPDPSLAFDGSGAPAIRLERAEPRATLGLATLIAALACLAFAALSAAPAWAVDNCPNAVFRSGPSAKLPDCRAYELVSPEFSDGLSPTAANFSNIYNAFEFPTINEAGDSVIFNTISGSISGFPGNGFNDRYRAKRTATGWVTEYFNPTAEQSSRPMPGAVAADHSYEFLNSGLNDFYLEPESTLQAPFGGKEADYLRKPNREYELIATGSLGSSPLAEGRLITPGGTHIIFTSQTKLEPLAKETGDTTVYDRPAGQATKVVSLLPDNSTPTGEVEFVGVSPDGTDVAFSDTTSYENTQYFVRHDNTTTKEYARSDGVQVGQELTCSGGPEYQWLRNGVAIGGATNASYTVAAADEGSVVQCQVTASSSEGSTIRTSQTRLLVAPFAGKNPPSPGFVSMQQNGSFIQSGQVQVGQEVSCAPGTWTGSPTLAYQWFRSGTPIAGATSATYTPVAADQDSALQCRVTGSNADGTVVAFSNVIRIGAPTPIATANPLISNVTDPGNAPEAGDELSCAPGTWSNSPTFSYQWLRNGTAIGGATSSTYTVVAADEGTVLQCAVTGTNSDGATQAVSARVVVNPQPGTAPPQLNSVGSLSGSGVVGSSLSCATGSWTGSPTFTRQWLRDGAEIAGATSSSYTPVAADLGTMIECRVTATNAGGGVVAINASAAKYVVPAIPTAFANLRQPGVIYAGIFGGYVFFGDAGQSSRYELEHPGDLFSFNIATGATSRITDVGDAVFTHVSGDGSHVYFISESEIGGEGSAGEPNLYVWSRAGGSTKFITKASPEDMTYEGANLASWTFAISAPKESLNGLGISNTRSTPDGSVFLFETKAQLTSFDNTEAAPEDCGQEFSGGDRCAEIYRYDVGNEELTCVSCPQGLGPATGEASMKAQAQLTEINPVADLTQDGSMAFFESSEDLLPEDGNGHTDVYRWKQNAPLSLISTGQSLADSHIYGVTADGTDAVFETSEPLLPQDENRGTPRIYDARVDGGFPPPESTVTEPCNGDACQGNPSAAPEATGISSSSLNGGGNVPPKQHCGKGKRGVVRHGKERCVKRHRRKHRHPRAGANRRAAR